MNLVTEIEIFPAGIPCTFIKPNFIEKPVGTIFLYHGWGNQTYGKKGFLFFANILAKSGYQVFVPELVYHGDRGSLDYDDQKVMREYFWNVLNQSVDEFDVIFDSVAKSYEIEKDKISLVGHSLGGMIASRIFINYDFIKGLVSMNSTSAFENLDRKYFAQSRKHITDEYLTELEYIKLRENDPVNSLSKLNQRHVLLLHGTVDEIVPLDAQKYFYDRAVSYYDKYPERLRFNESPDINHTIPLDMIRNTVEWIDCAIN